MRALQTVAMVAIMAGQVWAQVLTGTVVIYRQRGANFGLVHYAQGEHPTISCDGTNVARMAESRKALVSATARTHVCVANEKQYSGELNTDSDSVSVDIKPNETTYIRLEKPFGHIHFVLREVPPEVGKAQTEKMQPIKDKDSFASVLAK